MQTLSVEKNIDGDEDLNDGDDCLMIRIQILLGVAGLWCRP